MFITLSFLHSILHSILNCNNGWSIIDDLLDVPRVLAVAAGLDANGHYFHPPSPHLIAVDEATGVLNDVDVVRDDNSIAVGVVVEGHVSLQN